MSAWAFARFALAAAFAAWAAPASGGEIAGSPLALATVRLAWSEGAAASVPPADETAWLARSDRGWLAPVAEGPLLAQRAITREWGPSEDTTYVEFDLPGYKSEGWAMMLSGAVPGAGHFYLGESSAWVYLLAEIAGWTTRQVLRNRAESLHRESIDFAGSPYDTTANWSFLRFARATQSDTLELQRLYAGDRDAFYRLVGFDERYKLGWKPDAFIVRDVYQMIENRHQRHLKRARYATGAILFTHLVSALDALQAARRNNLPLQRNLRLRLEGSLVPDGERMALALERRF